MSVEFEPVRLGRPGRGIDPTVVGLIVVVVALAVAIAKPWGGDETGAAAETPGIHPASAGASPTPRSFGLEPRPRGSLGEVLPPTWTDIVEVVPRRQDWGIRAIVLGPTVRSGPDPELAYTERWVPADIGDEEAAVLDPRDAAVVALGITFPYPEAPLAVRIWLTREDAAIEWIDVRPVNDVPADGAYLFLRRTEAGEALRPWEPGRYRFDVLVGHEIRQFRLEVRDPAGVLPPSGSWAEGAPQGAGLSPSGLAGLPIGLFLWADGSAAALASTGGPDLSETGAWLDLDLGAGDRPPRSFTARVYQPGATWLGVVLPAGTAIRWAVLDRLAPRHGPADLTGQTLIEARDRLSFAAFARPGGATWRPGVYALRMGFMDSDGAHEMTWHVELRPGPVGAEPVLLGATRAWARYAGSSGILPGTTVPIQGGPGPSEIRLLEIVPATAGTYAGLSGSNLIGCGATLIRGRPTVLGFVGPETSSLSPVTSTIQFPFADVGPMPVLTAAGAVPGLALAAPVLATEFGGPASYGFRVGASADAPGYTMCIGMPMSSR